MTATNLKAAATGRQQAVRTADNGEMNVFKLMEQYKGQIKNALPEHMKPDRLIRIVTTEIRKTPKLLQCNPKSLFGAVIQCSQLGLEPGGALGHVYLLPFENKKAKTVDVQLIIGYRGMIDLARRSGQIISISARSVYENDEFSYQYGLDENIIHIPYNGDNRGKLTHVYAVAKLREGGVQFEVLTLPDINRAKALSKTSSYGPWVDHFEEMAKKTAVRRLFKYLPISIEIQRFTNVEETTENTQSNADFSGVLEGDYSAIIDEDGVINEPMNNDESAAVELAPRTTQEPPIDNTPFEAEFDKVLVSINNAKDVDVLDIAADLINSVPDADNQAILRTTYEQRRKELTKK